MLNNKFHLFQIISLFTMVTNRCLLFLLTLKSIPLGPGIVAVVVGVYWWTYTITLPFFGALVEKFSRFKLIVFSISLQLCTVILLFKIDGELNAFTTITLASILAISGMLYSISSVSYTAFLSENIHNIEKAFKFRSFILSFTTFMGPAITGGLLTFVGNGGTYLTIIIFLVFSLVSLFILPVDIAASKSIKKSIGTWFVDTKDGMNAVRKSTTELHLSLFMMYLNLYITPFVSIILPLIITVQLELEPVYLGIATSFFGIGMVISSLFVTTSYLKTHMKNTLCILGILSISVGLLIASTVSDLKALSVAMFIIGLGVGTFNSITTSSRAKAIPDEYRSRIESLVLFIALISIPIGSFAVGILLNFFTPNLLAISFSILSFISIFIFIKIPYINELLLNNHDPETPFYKSKFPSAFK